jgi:hypothetical protein
LIRGAGGFAVVERRNGRIYPMTPGEREGVGMTAEAVSALLAQEGCLPESKARRLINELSKRGDSSLGRSDERDSFAGLRFKASLRLMTLGRRGDRTWSQVFGSPSRKLVGSAARLVLPSL